MTPEQAEERECMAEDRAKGKREDALIESGIVERFLRGGFECATFPGGQLLTKDEHKVVCAHIEYLKSKGADLRMSQQSLKISLEQRDALELTLISANKEIQEMRNRINQYVEDHEILMRADK